MGGSVDPYTTTGVEYRDAFASNKKIDSPSTQSTCSIYVIFFFICDNLSLTNIKYKTVNIMVKIGW